MVAGATARLDLRLLAPALLGWAIVAAGLQVSPRWSLGLGVVAALSAAALLRRPYVSRRTVALGAAVIALLGLSTGLHGLIRATGPVEELAADRATVTLRGTLAADPHLVRAAGAGEGAASVVVRLKVTEVVGRGERARVRTTVLTFGDRRWSELRWRDEVSVRGRLAPAEVGSDVVALLAPIAPPERVGAAPALLRGVETLRAHQREATAPLPADARGLIPAVVIGDISRVPPTLRDDMRATGMTHLTAVSGANVTIVLMCVLWACGWVRVPRRWRLPVALVALALFVLLCRPEPSVARAGVMGVVGLLATSSGRPRAAAPALGAAVVGLLALDPWLATSYGFALSALATLGLVVFARTWGRWFADRLPGRLRGLGEPLAIPVAAQVMCTPVVVLLQGAVPLVGVPANVLAAPLVAPATVAGVLVVLLAPVLMPLATGVAWLAALPAELIAEIAHVAARVPGGALPWPGGAAGALLLALLTAVVLLCGVWFVAHGRRHPAVLLALALVVAAAAWPLPQPGWPVPGWVLVACDVGQGDAAVVRTPPGSVVVIDTGPKPDRIDRCLDDLGVDRVETVVLTHFHADHVGGIAGVLDGRAVGQIITTSVHENGGGGDEASLEPLVRRIATAHRIPVQEVRAGAELSWPGVFARVLWPARAIRSGSVQNNASIVLDLRVGGLRVVLLGDAEREAQAQTRRALERLADPQPVEIVKVAHHGSGNHDPALLRRLAATHALISVGADNDYGHPSPRLLASVREAGSHVTRTDRGGDLAVVPHAHSHAARVVTRRG